MVVSYAGGVTIPATASDSLYHSSLSTHMMTATTETVLDSVLVSGLVKNEPEDLTGQRQRWVSAEHRNIISEACLCFIYDIKMFFNKHQTKCFSSKLPIFKIKFLHEIISLSGGMSLWWSPAMVTSLRHQRFMATTHLITRGSLKYLWQIAWWGKYAISNIKYFHDLIMI